MSERVRVKPVAGLAAVKAAKEHGVLQCCSDATERVERKRKKIQPQDQRSTRQMAIVFAFVRPNKALSKSCGCGVCKQNKHDVTHFSSCCLPPCPPLGFLPAPPFTICNAGSLHEICKSVRPITATAPNTVNLSDGFSVPHCTKPIVISVICASVSFSVIDCAMPHSTRSDMLRQGGQLVCATTCIARN